MSWFERRSVASGHSRPFLLLVLLLVCSVVQAAAPSTLAYQGRLADAGGTPISANLQITFRLYSSETGGSALWSEVQSNVDVDGGNLAVELGRITALPASIWGQQLFLGIQITGDSEMAPRPRLTAAPFALRAASLQRRSRVVSAEGSPTENGALLLQVVASITDASAASPVAVELDAGNFDLGTNSLVMPAFTALIGKGQSSTLITSAAIAPDSVAAVLLGSDTEVRDLTVRHTGVSPGESDSMVGLGAYDPSNFDQALPGIRLTRVTGESIAASGSNGQRAGISLCVRDSSVNEVTARAMGGMFAMALRAHCPGGNLSIDGATLQASDARDGVRGAYLSAQSGNQWRRLRVDLAYLPSVTTVYGLRFLGLGSFPSSGPSGLLTDSSIRIRGDLNSVGSALRVEGIVAENGAQLAAIQRVDVHLDGVRGKSPIGIRLLDSSSNAPALAATRISDSQIRVSALQEVAAGIGDTVGLRAEGFPPLLRSSRIEVECRAGDVGPCIGVAQPENWVAPAGSGELLIVQTDVSVRHLASAGGAARAAALQLMGRARIEASSFDLLRSSGNEPVAALRLLSPNARLRLVNSRAVVSDAADNLALCLLEGPAGAGGEWFGNHLQGARCDAAQVNLECAGNTLRGTGFIAGACP